MSSEVAIMINGIMALLSVFVVLITTAPKRKTL